MVIVGTGGHGREVHDVAAAAATGVVSGENVDLEFLGFLDVFVGHEALLGINSSVIQGVRVGAGATVGAGGVAIRDVSAGSIAVGVPARPRG